MAEEAKERKKKIREKPKELEQIVKIGDLTYHRFNLCKSFYRLLRCKYKCVKCGYTVLF